MPPRLILFAAFAVLPPLLFGASVGPPTQAALERDFTRTVRPFVDAYCLGCHGQEKTEAELDLRPFTSAASVVGGFDIWELVQERLESAEMPPTKAKRHPAVAERAAIVAWIRALRQSEAERNAGDPGPVLARRLSNAEYDYTIRDLTGFALRPTREFPVDPANQAGFDNSGESLAMSPALVKKYLGAARSVAEHLVLTPDGFVFAPHPVVADTDRDKYAVLRIVDFYARQPTDYADYFQAAWRYRERVSLGQPSATLADIAAGAKISAGYLGTIWTALTDDGETVGPMAALRTMWRALPSGAEAEVVRRGCVQMRDYVLQLRPKLVPEVKNLPAPGTGIQDGSQTLVMWKNRQMAANRRRLAPDVLLTAAEAAEADARRVAALAAVAKKMAGAKAPPKPSANSDRIQKGGEFLAPTITTIGSSATFQMATAKDRGSDPDLIVPDEPAARARHEAAFARFADIFPDAFYITERARVYLEPGKEKNNAGRLLSAGLHSMTGYFRDDGPLYDLILDDAGRRELDRLWREFDFLSLVPHRMHTSFVWFERTDSSYMRDAEFDPYRPEDKSVVRPEKIARLAELYLDKAKAKDASAAVQGAIQEHFGSVIANIRRVDADRAAAEPRHLVALLEFAARAYRRPLSAGESEGLHSFYQTARDDNGGDHEEAMRDCLVRVLMSPNFCYRIDLSPAPGVARNPDQMGQPSAAGRAPLDDYALASRLSYFLWSSQPDAALLARAAAGELHRPAVITAEARRMWRDARVRNFATEFAGAWLDFRRFEEHNGVDRGRFPAFDNELRRAFFEEPVRFLTALIQEERPVLDCLYADYTLVNAPLAKHYGMPVAETLAATPDTWTRVEHAGDYGRGGLLPMAVFLTANSPGLRTSPVKRGYWVARRVLGERIPPPPPTVPALPGDEKDLGELTLRETLARHRADQACAGCHARFDSFGLVFEGYGAVGERRTLDFGGRPVDTHADFPGGSTREGLGGLRDYIRAQRESDFSDNLCRKLLAYALGRTLLPSDDRLIAGMRATLSGGRQSFSGLFEAIVTSPQFLTKRAAAPALVTRSSSN